MLLLHKYINDLTHVLRIEDVELKGNFVYEKHPIYILDRWVKKLRNKQIFLVKVLGGTIKLRRPLEKLSRI